MRGERFTQSAKVVGGRCCGDSLLDGGAGSGVAGHGPLDSKGEVVAGDRGGGDKGVQVDNVANFPR